MNNTHAKLYAQSDKFAQDLIKTARETHREAIHSKLDRVIKDNYSLVKSGKFDRIDTSLKQIGLAEKDCLDKLKK
jgi:hypothetical protein